MRTADVRSPAILRSRLALVASSLREEDGMVAFDGNLRYVHWNHRMEIVTGLPAARVLGRVATDVFPRFLADGEQEHMRSALSGRTIGPRATTLDALAGSQTKYEIRYFPCEGDDGEVLAAIAIVRDLTGEQRMHQKLVETESRFRMMADHSPVMLWMSGTDALCTFFNQTWLMFTGRSLEKEIGVGWAEGLHPQDFQHCMDTYLAAFSRREQFELEYRLRRADGEWRWILDRGTPRTTPMGEFAGYIGSCVDITEHKHLEEELRQRVRERDDFLSIASHELKTPLTTVQFSIDWVIRAARERPGEDAWVGERHSE